MFAVDVEMEGSLNCGDCILNKECFDIPSSVNYEYNGKRLLVCPRVIITEKSYFLIGLFKHYRNGYLFYGGGVSGQPQWYLRAMEIVEGTMVKFEEAEQKRKERKAP